MQRAGPRDATVSEWAVGAILGMEKGLFAAARRQAEGSWDGWQSGELEGRTALIVGFGSIGRAIAARLAPFGMRVVGVGRSARDGIRGREALPELLPGADVVVLVMPSTPESRGSVDRDVLARMRDGALLVNVGRGDAVDIDALTAEVVSGRLRAALDVTHPEPLPPDHPLWRAPGAFITPHVSGDSAEADGKAIRLAVDQLRRYAGGEPLLNVVEGA